MIPSRTRRRFARDARGAVVVVVMALAGCAAGPNFKPPPPPNARGYLARPLHATPTATGAAAGVAQHFKRGARIPGNWWTRFHSRSLDTLVKTALERNHDLKAAKAALKAAHEDVLAQRGTFFPSLSADVSASRQQDPSATLSPTPANNALLYGLITPQLDIAYAPDLFGLHRRTRESLKAQAQAVRFQMLAAWTSLTTNVVVTAVERASLHAQLEATRQLVKLEQKSLDILKLRLQKGDASGLDVSAQQAQLAQSVVAEQALDKQLAVTQHRLDVLVGAFPDRRPEQEFSLADLKLPTSLPVSLPTTLVAQRPDVRQARADLHAASAAIGIAAAERLPNITLTADVGSSALKISKVFTSGTGFWGIAASLTAPIFEAGRLAHHELAAKAAYVVAAQQYRSTVLRAFENVADTLAALERDAKSLKAAATAAQAAKTTLHLSQLKLQHGAIGTFALLVAERTFQQAKIGLAQAKANRFSDTAALYQALGGGWWHHVGLAKQ